MSAADRADAAEPAATAKLLVLVLAFCWGLNWVAAAIALRDIPPWSLRFVSTAIGVVTLFVAAWLSGRSLYVPRNQRIHVMVAGFFNVAAFNMLSLFAQLGTATSRVVIIAYSMPIWTALLGRLMLGERLNPVKMLALVLCVSGLSILIWPLVSGGVPVAVFYALGCAWSWAFATVYIKWAKVSIDPLVNAAWQLLFGVFVITLGMVAFDGAPQLWPLHAPSIGAILFMGLLGTGLAHFVWWAIVGRLPAVTAGLGALLVPIVGVTGAAAVLGERPSVPDLIGFALVFVAAASVLLQRTAPKEALPE